MRKKLEDMNLLDNFLFGSVVTYPGIGEEFTRKLLKIIFGREFKRLSVYPQKVFYGNNSNLHGTRLDVYLEEAENEALGEQATVYDIEPDKNDGESEVKALPRRIRFYHAKIDAQNLKSGVDYEKLKNVVIIMIMPYDPFGLKRMVYTIKNGCVEVPDMEYEDGASTLFLYTGGTEGNPEEALKQLLYYMEDTTRENAVNEDLQDIHGMIETVKQDAEVTVRYMRLMEDERILIHRERRFGMEEGEKIGLEKGERIGLEKGERIGLTKGEIYKLISMVCKKMQKNKSPEEIAWELEEDIAVIEPIYKAVKESGGHYDCGQIYEKLTEVLGNEEK